MFASEIDGLWDHPQFPQIYPDLLRQVYYFSQHSLQCMRFALEKCKRQPDATTDILIPYFEKHIIEENGHCEWAMDDLIHLGYDEASERKRSMTAYVAGLTGCAYTWVDNYHPATLLGFLYNFEGNVPSESFLHEKIRQHGLPPEAFSFFLHHAQLDIAHGAEIISTLDQLDLTPEQEESVTMCALHAQYLTHHMLRGILPSPAHSSQGA